MVVAPMAQHLPSICLVGFFLFFLHGSSQGRMAELAGIAVYSPSTTTRPVHVQPLFLPFSKKFIFHFEWSAWLVYVIGLHAVQFGNNWIQKIPRTVKLDSAYGLVQFGSPRNCLNPIISKLDKHVVLLPINYRASKNSLFKAKLNVRAKLSNLF